MINYIPFFIMGRKLFLHHYLPSFCFAACLAAAVVEHVFVDVMRARRGMQFVTLLVGGLCLATFMFFAPMT